MPHAHGIYLSTGNSKVRFPILNLGSGTDCPSARWCPFDADNRKASGRRWCYAQKMEALRPSVLASRRRNEAIIKGLSGQAMIDVANDIADAFAWMLRKRRKVNRIVRINESGDLEKGNIAFACAVIRALQDRGIKAYLYSKSAPIYRRMAMEAGAIVLHSEHDFVAVSSKEEGAATGLNRCPGTCGPCKACPSGQRSWILEH